MYNTFGNGAVINFTLRIGMPQMELGAFPTSVIPTYGSTATRAADVFTVPTTAAGANGAWYTQGVGTLGVSAIMPYQNPNGEQGYCSLDDGTNSNAIHMFMGLGASWYEHFELFNSGSLTYGYTATNGYTAGSLDMEALAFQINNVRGESDATSGFTSASATVPTVTELRIGANRHAIQLDGWITRLWYMPTRQPDASLPGYTN